MPNTDTATDTDCPDCWAATGEPHTPDCAIECGRLAVTLARTIALDPRFAARDSYLFDEYAKTYGRDRTGFAWVQACLAVDQSAV